MAGDGETLLAVAQRLGVDIESICGGRQTCAKCKVRIDEGDFPKHGIRSFASHLSEIGIKEANLLSQGNGSETGKFRLACAAAVHGDVLVYVPEESRAHKQTIRKVAGERAIDVEPAVRQVYVEVDAAQLGEHRGDWGRLQSALHLQCGLSDMQIDLTALRKLQPACATEIGPSPSRYGRTMRSSTSNPAIKRVFMDWPSISAARPWPRTSAICARVVFWPRKPQ